MSEEIKNELKAEIRELRIASLVFMLPMIAWLSMMACQLLLGIEIITTVLAFFCLYFAGGWVSIFLSYISLDLDRDLDALRKRLESLK